MTCVLLAEDDTSISEPLARALRREGYDVDVSADGPGTLQVAMAGGIDLIVLDIGLPRMNGYEVARRMREITGLRETVLIATPASAATTLHQNRGGGSAWSRGVRATRAAKA